MKKNIMMRVASTLLIAVLLSTCAISGTFAKYITSADAQDSARVAKWGVTVAATGNDAFAEKYDDAVNASGTKVVSVGGNVLAPGTYGDLASISITGAPEVMVNVAVNATLTLTGWMVDITNDGVDNAVEYCPIVFTVGSETYGLTGIKDYNGDALDHSYTTITELKNAIEGLFNAMDKTNVPANTPLTADIEIDWEWAFEGNEDAKDTALGNLGTAPTIAFACDVTVTQVD